MIREDASSQMVALGKPKSKPESPDEAPLDTIPNLWPDADYEVCVTYTEFVSLCPLSARLDLGEIKITYVPSTKLIETMALTTYLESFRNYTCFLECAVNKICYDLGEALEPVRLEVLGRFRQRDSISVSPIARWKTKENMH
ncbi:MAG: preQ(1) synthase [Verrucomicrobia bacterium]|nr:preQ(1) synthase [Verrucomicrobiota bacterium]